MIAELAAQDKKRSDISTGDGQFRPRAKSGLGTEKSIPDLEISELRC